MVQEWIISMAFLETILLIEIIKLTCVTHIVWSHASQKAKPAETQKAMSPSGVMPLK